MLAICIFHLHKYLHLAQNLYIFLHFSNRFLLPLSYFKASYTQFDCFSALFGFELALRLGCLKVLASLFSVLGGRVIDYTLQSAR